MAAVRPVRWAQRCPHGGWVAAVAAAALLVLGGCDLLGDSRSPTPCDQVFSAKRCLAMTDWVAAQLNTTRDEVAALDILPEPTLQIVDGKTILTSSSGGPPIDVRVTLADGSTRRVSMCGGIPSSPACYHEPHLTTSSPTQGGYYDVPEGASPVPSPVPEAIADALALRIDRLDIAVDGVGIHEIRLGEALLPNGLLTTAEFELVDTWPEALSIVDGRVHLEVRSLETGAVLWNSYEHGWREGTERVEAVLVFDVFHVDPGAVLSIRDVVVE